MDTTDPSISFDHSGVCDHCLTFDNVIKPNWSISEKKLSSLFDVIKKSGSGKDFDCIIGMSGGIDSSYLTYMAHSYGLRPLVFHVDAGWNTKEAVNNIDCLVTSLGLDLYTEVINWEEMRDLQLAYFKASVPHIDSPQDHAFFATMYKFALKHDVKYILTGANYSTECIRNPLEWMYYQSDSTQLKDIYNTHGNGRLKTFPLMSIFSHKIWLPYFKRIRVLAPLNYMPYDKARASSLLASKFGWQPYPQKHFESRFTRFYEGYWLLRKFGYDTRKVQFSSLILTNQMTRDEALERLKSPPLSEEEVAREFQYVATKLCITPAELQSFFELPNKTFRDYKSQSSIYALGSKVLKLLNLELGGKR